MQLPPEQVKRFYYIWFELLHYVHEQRHLAPNFPDTPTAMSISPDDALQLRNTLWADDVLRESFIATNPVGLSSPDLALVASWKYRVDGKFLSFVISKDIPSFSQNNLLHMPMEC